MHHFSCPRTHEQNGSIERKHRHVGELYLFMMFDAYVQKCYWIEAFSSISFLIKHLTHKVVDFRSPLEVLFAKIPDYSSLRVFRS